MSTWALGFPDRASERIEEAVALASGEGSQPFSLANTLAFAALLHVFRREAPSAQARTETSMQICLEQRIPFWLEWGRVLHGWAIAAQGEGEDGIAEVRRGLEAFRALTSRTMTANLLALQAEVYAGLGRPGEALSAIDEGFATMQLNGELWWEAELHRLTGDIVLAQHDGNQAEAEMAFSRALSTAHNQEARSLELRAATSLARLWQSQDKAGEARDLLAPIYGWFTEGFGTADLKDAKALLDELC